MPRLRLFALRALIVLAIGLVSLLAGVKIVYGGGQAYPDLSRAPRVTEVERIASMDLPLGNVAASADGRVFFNTHPFTQSHRFADTFLFELVDGEPRAYPDAASQDDLKHMFGMTVDRQGRLWLTSPATLDRERTRLVAYDLSTDQRVVDHAFDPGVARFAQDMRVLPDGRHMIMADTGAFHFTPGSLLVVDLETFAVRRVLDGHPSTQPQDWFIRTAHGPHRVGYGLVTFAVGVDGIALSADGAWAYYAPMSGDGLYRVPTEALLDESRTNLADVVERLGDKPLSDGIEVAPDGSVLITDIEHRGMARMTLDGRLETLTKSDDVVWADGVTVAPDGAVLFTDSAIPSYLDPLLAPPSEDRMAAGAPYGLYRFRLPE